VLDATLVAMAKADVKAIAKASARAVAAAKLISEAELDAREVADRGESVFVICSI
jgi:hypothetical protein